MAMVCFTGWCWVLGWTQWFQRFFHLHWFCVSACGSVLQVFDGSLCILPFLERLSSLVLSCPPCLWSHRSKKTCRLFSLAPFKIGPKPWLRGTTCQAGEKIFLSQSQTELSCMSTHAGRPACGTCWAFIPGWGHGWGQHLHSQHLQPPPAAPPVPGHTNRRCHSFVLICGNKPCYFRGIM